MVCADRGAGAGVAESLLGNRHLTAEYVKAGVEHPCRWFSRDWKSAFDRGGMNPLTGLTDYLGRVERRLRVLAVTKGAAITAAAALIFTVLAVLLANAFAFSDPSVTCARVLLFVALALALGVGLVVPLLRLNRRNAARETERNSPNSKSAC